MLTCTHRLSDREPKAGWSGLNAGQARVLNVMRGNFSRKTYYHVKKIRLANT